MRRVALAIMVPCLLLTTSNVVGETYEKGFEPVSGDSHEPDDRGGMSGDGWDGPGTNRTTVFFHIQDITSDISADVQRQTLLEAMQVWADVVQITFAEVALPDVDRAIDFAFVVRDHSDEHPQDICPFDGQGGTLAHAMFPPGVSTKCGVSREPLAGDVHFDDDEEWEAGNSQGPFAHDLLWVAVHEIGHALGLEHSSADADVMHATVSAPQNHC